MTWILIALLVGVGFFIAMVGFNYFTAWLLMRGVGYNWRQVQAHMLLRDRLTRRKSWDVILSPLLNAYIKAQDERRLTVLGAFVEGERFECQRFLEFVIVNTDPRSDTHRFAFACLSRL